MNSTRPTNRVTSRGPRGFSIMEVAVGAAILGTVAVSYAGIYKVSVRQRLQVENEVYALELISRQIEFLRLQDLRQSPPPGCPFTEENFRSAPLCRTYRYGGAGTHNLEIGASPPVSGDIDFFLTDANSYRFPANTDWLVRTGNANVGMQMPPQMDARGFTVVVHARRVQDARNPSEDGMLVKYQVSVLANGLPVLVVPYLVEVPPLQ